MEINNKVLRLIISVLLVGGLFSLLICLFWKVILWLSLCLLVTAFVAIILDWAWQEIVG